MQVSSSTSYLADEDDRDDLLSAVAEQELEEMRQEVINEISIQHPITFQSYNICEYNKFWREGSPKLLKTKLTEQSGTIYSPRHQASRVQCHFELDTSQGQRFRAAILAGQLTSSTEPDGFPLPPGDASVGSWFREIPVPRTWRVYLATGFDFHEKNRACFGSIGVLKLASVSYLVTIL